MTETTKNASELVTSSSLRGKILTNIADPISDVIYGGAGLLSSVKSYPQDDYVFTGTNQAKLAELQRINIVFIWTRLNPYQTQIRWNVTMDSISRGWATFIPRKHDGKFSFTLRILDENGAPLEDLQNNTLTIYCEDNSTNKSSTDYIRSQDYFDKIAGAQLKWASSDWWKC